MTTADSPGGKDELDRRFRALAFHNPILPGQTNSGFVLTHLNEGAKLVQLDLVASAQARTFSILMVVPGFYADYHVSEVFRRDIYPPEKIVNYTDDDAFRAALEALPCCATNEDGSKNGDPLNLVLVGGLDDAFPALVRRGWSPTEQKWSGAIMKMVTSALSGDRYVNAPVSDLYLFGRAQDLALQKARDNVHQRNHLRLWLSPMRYRGKPVWVGQISRDIGTRLTIHSPTFTTHKIDPDVDEARRALAEDMAYSQNLTKIGFVKGVGAAPQSAPSENLTTDPYYTDGYRQVLVFDRHPTSLSEIEILPVGDERESQQQPAFGSETMSAPPSSPRALRNAAGSVVLLLVFAGCATWTAPTNLDDAPLRERAVSATKQDVQVSAAVLGSEDSKRMFGADINKTNVQPLWIEVQNRTSQPLWLLQSGTDPDYFSPLEVAWSMHTLLGGATNASIDDHFNKLGFKNPIPAGRNAHGDSVHQPGPRSQARQYRSVRKQDAGSLLAFLPVPDDVADPRFALTLFQYPDTEITDYHDLASLRAALERLPCCASDQHATTGADPLNVIVIGNLGDIGAALVRRSYRRDLRERRSRRNGSSDASRTSSCARRRKRARPRPRYARGSRPFASTARSCMSCRSDGRSAAALRTAARQATYCTRTSTRQEISWFRT